MLHSVDNDRFTVPCRRTALSRSLGEALVSCLAIILTLMDLCARGLFSLCRMSLYLLFMAAYSLLMMSAFIIVYIIAMAAYLALGPGVTAHFS